jgi:peptide chain release factor 1
VQTVQGKSRTSNTSEAMKNMIAELDRLKTEKENEKENGKRKSMIGSGMRADKIRTYRFQDDQVIDHRSDKTSSCKRIMKGFFDDLWE